MFILFITSKIIYASLLTGNWSKLNSHTFSASKKKKKQWALEQSPWQSSINLLKSAMRNFNNIISDFLRVIKMLLSLNSVPVMIERMEYTKLLKRNKSCTDLIHNLSYFQSLWPDKTSKLHWYPLLVLILTFLTCLLPAKYICISENTWRFHKVHEMD